MNAAQREALTGRVALVTGSTDGIGKATATALAELGATVIVVGRNQERGTTAVAEIVRAAIDLQKKNKEVRRGRDAIRRALSRTITTRTSARNGAR